MAGNAEMEDHRHLSLRLYEVLEKVGASEKMRNLHKRTSTTTEILETVGSTLMCDSVIQHYLCGSSYEGSITPDLFSDVDDIMCFMSPPVVLDQHEQQPELSLLMVTDAWTYPGYVKLQWMFDGRPLTGNDLIPLPARCDVDKVGRLCLRHFHKNNGPAVKKVDVEGNHYRDNVNAFKCNTLPLFASNRLNRLRQRRLISIEEFDKLQRTGCMLVSAGYFLSLEREIEWRLSLSLQERHMMSKLNPTQHKVYILLKIIKVNIIEKVVKCKVFTSYHCKTCVLYAVEMTPRQSWTPDNLISCLMQCIKLLILWLRNNYCPNYFNSNQNLFSKKNFSYFRQSLLQTMQFLLRSNNKYLQLLQTDHMWPILLENDCQGRTAVAIKRSAHTHQVKQLNIQAIDEMFQNIMYRLCGEGQYSASSLNDALKLLQQTDAITEHTTTETQAALDPLYPWFHLHIAKSLASLYFRYHDRSCSKRILKAVDTHFRKAEFTDLVNVRLAKATILYKVEQYETCFILLQQIESDFTHKVTRMCPCVQLYSHMYRDEQSCRERKRTLVGMSVRKIMKYYTAVCVVFLPSQFQIVPPPLEYEMFRSFGTQPGSRIEMMHFWYDWCVIDAKVFLYFMQYLVCTELHKQTHKQVAMDNIRAAIEEDNILVLIQYQYEARQLGHRETAYNLLGWIYMQEQRYGDAMHCFLKSWKIRPFHNAAKFHMRDLVAKLSQRR